MSPKKTKTKPKPKKSAKSAKVKKPAKAKKTSRPKSKKNPAYAVIDIGTNTLILLIARAGGKGAIEVLYDHAVVARLGQGLSQNHFFLSEAIKRVMDVLKQFKTVCERHEVTKIVAVGTAACRIAANTDVFLTQVKRELGLKIEVISGDAEAQYTFGAAYTDFGKKKKKLIVVDIGGGSTEIITGPLASKNFGPETVISMPLGSVRLTEQYVHSDPINDEDFNRLHLGIKNDLKDELDDFYPPDFDPSPYTIVATAGTATTLAALKQGLKIYRPDKVHGSSLTENELAALMAKLVHQSIRERQQLPGMDPGRADVILAGGLLLLEIMRYFRKSELIVSDRGLRYGVFFKKFLS